MNVKDHGLGVQELSRDFRPPGLLRNPHIQSILASLKVRRPLVYRQAQALLKNSESHVLDCGDGVRLQGSYSGRRNVDRGLAVLIHGWEGSADSLYILSAGSYLYDRGFDIFRLNLRDHGPTHHLNRDIFHACRIDEVVGAVKAIQERFQPERLFLGGFSLGGNFALRVAVRAPKAGIRLNRTAAVSPVLNPCRTMDVLESGWRVYHNYFMHKWRNSLHRKRRVFSDLTDLKHLTDYPTLRRMTDYFAPIYSGFSDGDAYLNGYAITGNVLADLSAPAHILTSLDDPVIPACDLSDLARPTCLSVEVTRYGGHCGFFTDYRLRSLADPWMEKVFSQSGRFSSLMSGQYTSV